MLLIRIDDFFSLSADADAFNNETNGDGVYELEPIGNVAFVHVMAW